MKTAREFYDFFEAIPEDRWCCDEYTSSDGRHCAYEHCQPESKGAILSICENAGYSIENVNDGLIKIYQQPTPKQRILAFLKDAVEAGL